MIRIKTYVTHSPINGLGVFSGEKSIPKGTLIWSFEDNFDRIYTPEEYMAFSDSVKQYLGFYGYRYKKDGMYYLPVDNDRFVNHSIIPNTYDADDGNIYALREILENEEITTDYAEFDYYWEQTRLRFA